VSVNDVVLWLVVAAVAFLVGQGRIALRGAPVLSDRSPDAAPDAWQYDEADVVRVYRRHTLRRLVTCYNMDELRTLAFDIGLQHEQIGGDTLSAYAMELLEYCERRGKLALLLTGMR